MKQLSEKNGHVKIFCNTKGKYQYILIAILKRWRVVAIALTTVVALVETVCVSITQSFYVLICLVRIAVICVYKLRIYIG